MIDLSGRNLVSTQWLAENLGLAENLDAPDILVLDGSWHLPGDHRDPRAEYLTQHIATARFFDIDAISDASSPLPHMLPSPAEFAQHMAKLGLGDNTAIVVYDASRQGLFSAARVWWMLRVFGHENVAVLDGGLKKWTAEGRLTTADVASHSSSAVFTPRLNASLVRNLADMRSLLTTQSAQIADARGAGRFAGTEPEPRPGLRSGHMPGARNVPFTTLLNPDGTMRPAAELRDVFERAGIDVAKPVVTSCGSGVTAAVVSLALAAVGQPNNGLYDGSWSEWGQAFLDTEIATTA